MTTLAIPFSYPLETSVCTIAAPIEINLTDRAPIADAPDVNTVNESRRRLRRRERGEGMMSYVMGTILFVVVAALLFGGYDYVMSKIQGVVVSWAINTTMGDVRSSVAGGSGQYDTGNLYSAVKTSGAFPWFATPDDTNQAFNLMFGGEMRVVGAGSTFQVNISNIKQSVCMAQATKNFGQKSVTINSSSFTPKASTVQASSNCADGMNSFGVTAS